MAGPGGAAPGAASPNGSPLSLGTVADGCEDVGGGGTTGARVPGACGSSRNGSSGARRPLAAGGCRSVAGANVRGTVVSAASRTAGCGTPGRRYSSSGITTRSRSTSGWRPVKDWPYWSRRSIPPPTVPDAGTVPTAVDRAPALFPRPRRSQSGSGRWASIAAPIIMSPRASAVRPSRSRLKARK